MRSHVFFKKKYGIVLLIPSLLLVNCATRHFMVQTVPEGALVTSQHLLNDSTKSMFLGYHDESPTKATILFLGKKDKYAINAEKRGYYPSSMIVTKNSPLDIIFEMDTIPGISKKSFDTSTVKNNNYLFLPGNVEVYLHSGVGNLDKYTISSELSTGCTVDLNSILATELLNNKQSEIIPLDSFENKADWDSLSNKLTQYLLSLDIRKLDYYGVPPVVDTLLYEYSYCKDIIDKNCQQTGDKYLVYLWIKGITETSGRKIGNAMMLVANAAVEGYHTAQGSAYYSDPSAFFSDTGSLVMFYIIDPVSYELVHVMQLKTGYDITKDGQLIELTNRMTKFPVISK